MSCVSGIPTFDPFKSSESFPPSPLGKKVAHGNPGGTTCSLGHFSPHSPPLVSTFIALLISGERRSHHAKKLKKMNLPNKTIKRDNQPFSLFHLLLSDHQCIQREVHDRHGRTSNRDSNGEPPLWSIRHESSVFRSPILRLP